MYNRKKELIKSGLIIGFILLIAVVSTHHIYFKYNDEGKVDYTSESLDIVFHEKSGSKVTLNKVTPVTDSVGLSSNAYTFTITNNKQDDVNYKINLEDDADVILEDDCKEYLIGKQFLRVSVKEGNKDNKIYTLEELEDGLLAESKLKSGESKKYSVRIWVNKDITIPTGSNLHYHGIIKVTED